MKLISYLIVSILTFPAVAGAQKINGPAYSDPYKEKVMHERKAKDLEFRDSKGSPLEPDDIKDFNGLNYYSYDSKYRVTAILEKIEDYKIIRMKTTTDRRPEYKTWARARFTLDGVKCQLMIYQPIDLMQEKGFENYLFLPFTDETSGRDTYGGGRFLELTFPEGNTMIIDFNSAFNPYCAYNHKYSCPVPPEENDLSVRIEAGELPFKPPKKHRK
jgi:uncharacterized protein (DUF1684 family)